MDFDEFLIRYYTSVEEIGKKDQRVRNVRISEDVKNQEDRHPSRCNHLNLYIVFKSRVYNNLKLEIK